MSRQRTATGGGEKEYYPIVRDWLEELLTQRFGWCYLEITAHRQFSNEIKAHIMQGREMVFQFLKTTHPDITGFVDRSKGSGFIVADVKAKAITLPDIYQAKRYAELFSAYIGLLLSTEAIPKELKRLHEVAPVVLSTLTGHGRITLAQIRKENSKLTVADWFPGDPFHEGFLRRVTLG